METTLDLHRVVGELDDPNLPPPPRRQPHLRASSAMQQAGSS
jgi:hypothetical protein